MRAGGFFNPPEASEITMQVISVKEARKLLGTLSNNLSDDQVLEIVSLLTLLARSDLIKSRSKNIVGTNG